MAAVRPVAIVLAQILNSLAGAALDAPPLDDAEAVVEQLPEFHRPDPLRVEAERIDQPPLVDRRAVLADRIVIGVAVADRLDDIGLRTIAPLGCREGDRVRGELVLRGVGGHARTAR